MKFNLVLLVLLAQVAQAATPVLTRSYDNGRTGANTTETTFTPQLVAAKGLRKLKSLNIPDDPRIEAQPLYVPGVRIQKDNQLHNVVFVASMGNHVNFSKFCPPMVADGRLYVPTYNGRVDVYALND